LPNQSHKYLVEHIDEMSNTANQPPSPPSHVSPGCNVDNPCAFGNRFHPGFDVPKNAAAKGLILFFSALMDSSTYHVLIPGHIVW